ncbi:MAG TPA: cytochrome c [Bryobacteraceae bacterium]|nr:cytochrome c [Bryobacteraceae bacterium]HPT25437.1 cytochrome c [Bryobacteraceae bacterium]
MKNLWMQPALFTALALCAVAAPPASAPKKGDATKGKQVYEQCGICHSATTSEKKMGPSLMGLYKRSALKNGKKVTDATVADAINKGGNGMPPFAGVLSAAERGDLLAYLKTL